MSDMFFTNSDRAMLIENVRDCFNSADMIINDYPDSDMIITLPAENLEIQFRTYTNGEFSSLLIRWISDRPEDKKIHAYVEYGADYFDNDVYQLAYLWQDEDELEQILEALHRNLVRELRRLNRM